MATTKIIPNVLELNPGDPENVLKATNTSWMEFGENFNNKTYEVKSSENFIDEGKKIKIINILQDKILVKKSR